MKERIKWRTEKWRGRKRRRGDMRATIVDKTEMAVVKTVLIG